MIRAVDHAERAVEPVQRQCMAAVGLELQRADAAPGWHGGHHLALHRVDDTDALAVERCHIEHLRGRAVGYGNRRVAHRKRGDHIEARRVDEADAAGRSVADEGVAAITRKGQRVPARRDLHMARLRMGGGIEHDGLVAAIEPDPDLPAVGLHRHARRRGALAGRDRLDELSRAHIDHRDGRLGGHRHVQKIFRWRKRPVGPDPGQHDDALELAHGERDLRVDEGERLVIVERDDDEGVQVDIGALRQHPGDEVADLLAAFGLVRCIARAPHLHPGARVQVDQRLAGLRFGQAQAHGRLLAGAQHALRWIGRQHRELDCDAAALEARCRGHRTRAAWAERGEHDERDQSDHHVRGRRERSFTVRHGRSPKGHRRT